MKSLIRAVARRLLPAVRFGWRHTPAPVQRVVRRPARRVRSALGLGEWDRARDTRSVTLLRNYHPLVRLPLLSPSSSPSAAPREPVADPSVTIVITAHDDAAFLDVALQSVRRQDLADWECVVVDDASIDATADIVLRHAEADPRISLVRRDRNVGLAAARNTGLVAARGEFVAFLDGDDFLFPGTLGARVRAARSDDPAVAGSWCDWASVSEAAALETDPGSIRKLDTIDYLTGGGENQLISTSPLMRRDVLLSLSGYDPAFRTAEDFEFATRLFRNGFRLAYAPVVGVAYRQKRTSMISADPLAHARNAMRIYDYMSSPLTAAAVSALAVEPHREPPRGIPSPIKRLERLITFLTFAVLGDDDAQIAGLLDLMEPGLLGGSTFLVDVDGRIDAAIRRHSTRVSGFEAAEAQQVEAVVKTLLTERATADAPATRIEPHEGAIDPSRLTTLVPTHARVRPQRSLAAAGSWDVVLRADTPDAVRELALVGRELVEAGHRVAMIDPGGEDARRRLAFEGIHRVAPPVAPARLLITSAGQATDLEADAHLLVAAEPQPVAADVTADAVHTRGAWEGPATATVAGWHSRLDRLAAAADPQDGQARRGRLATVMVLGRPTAEITADAVLQSLGDDTILAPGFGAPTTVTVTEEAGRGLVPHVRAVVVVGDAPDPAEARAFGTPVVRLTSGDDLAGLSATLDAVAPVAVEMVATDPDSLARHVAVASELLARSG